ncbi:tandem-95 repeat protein [Salinibacterium sp. dk2585]|uniref:beta strand repeat-containing protein n=1 Tax=unclassified Salinibacterium TaxID=2632331 RepID=UPI0011C24362|nr:MULTISPECIES: Ig-like domain-containing protein [unclassified Salinibacterium]QEE60348.1 tandem-95 repeat protein [Salinibacterium sp. dk2585]TXK55421.1 tandem-95 repeat protein [Salinibacterium sp. dk5596]
MALLALGRALSPVAATLALAIGFTGLTVAAAPTDAAAAAAGTPFDCTEPRFFAQAEDSGRLQVSVGSYTQQGDSIWTAIGQTWTTGFFNALAFNPQDEYLYGTRYGGGTGVDGSLVRIDSDGGVDYIGVSSQPLGAPPSFLWDTGEFDSAGNYYVASGNGGTSTVHRISGLKDATSSSVPRPARAEIPLTQTVRIADLAYKDGLFWAPYYSSNNTTSASFYRIDLNNVLGNGVGRVTQFALPAGVPAQAYGSAFTMTNGNLAFIGTNNYMYQVSIGDRLNPTPALVSRVAAPPNQRSDATNCATAQYSSLSVEKTGPAKVGVGEPITWDVTVTNEGPGVTSGFVLNDLLPSGLSNVAVTSDDTSCVVNAAKTTATCNGGRLGVNETATVQVTATAPSTPGPLQNSAYVIGNEDPSPDPATTADTDVVISTLAGSPVSIPGPAGIRSFTGPTNGVVSFVGGAFTYTPSPGFSGRDQFSYTTAAGTITVYIVVDPLAQDDTATTVAGSPVTVDGPALVAAGTGTGLELTSVDNSVNGTVTIVDGDPVFTPTPGFSGTGSFDYTLTDDADSDVTATVTVTVTPTAGPLTRGTSTNTAINIPIADLLAASIGTGLEVSLGGAVNGDVRVSGANVVFDPAEDFSGPASFTYTVTDDEGQTASATVKVAVSPVAGNDSATTPAETSVSIAVLRNDNGSDLEITEVSTPSSGTALVDDDAILFTPADDFSGTATFTYEVTDDDGQTAVATVTVTVTPVAADDSRTTAAGAPLTVSASELAAAGIGSNLTVISVSNAGNGRVSLDAYGNPVFVPTSDFSGSASFDYTVWDAANQMATATVTVTVTPVGTDDTATTSAETELAIPVLDNDLGSGLTITRISSVMGGTAEIDGDSIDFMPTAGYSGPASLTYELRDTSNQVTTATVAIAVTPVAEADSASTTVGTAVTIDVLDGDTGSDLTLTNVTAPAGVDAAIVDGQVVYTPAAGFSGDVTFSYTVTDASLQTATANVTVTVLPTAADETAATTVNTPVTVPGTTLVDAGTGTALTLVVVSGEVNGTVRLVDGDAVFTPTAGFSGDASFTFTLEDPTGGRATGTVDVTIAPVASAVTASTEADVPVTVTASDLEDAGVGTGLELVRVGDPANGSVALDSDGDAVFTPTPGFSGTGTFTFTLEDDDGGTATHTVTVTVGPVANADSASTPIDTPVTVNVLTNDVGTSLGVTAHGSARHGTVTVAANGTLVYTPDAGFSGVDSLSYDLSADGGSDSAWVTILVTPNAPDDAAVTDAGKAVDIDVLANDGGTGLVVTATGTPTAGGTVTIEASGVRFTPAPGFSGIDTFTYTVTDAAGSTAVAGVTVSVLPLAAPVARDSKAGQPVTVDVLRTGTGTGLVVTSVVPSPHGATVINADGTITFTPRDGFSGVVDLEYTATDADGLTTVGTVALTVMPTAADDEVRTAAGEPVVISTLANDIGSGLTVIATTSPSNGTVVINADGTITYTPHTGFAGSDTFTYTVEDAAGSTVTASVSVVVGAALPFMGAEPGGLVLLAFGLLGLGGLGLLARMRIARPRHRAR